MFFYVSKPKTLFQQFNDLFNSFSLLDDQPILSNKEITSTKEKDAYKIIAKVPGFKKDEINLSVENGVLSITCKKQSVNTEKTWFENDFTKSIYLPDGLDPTRISAKLEDGILTINIPYEEKAKSHKIEIK